MRLVDPVQGQHRTRDRVPDPVEQVCQGEIITPAGKGIPRRPAAEDSRAERPLDHRSDQAIGIGGQLSPGTDQLRAVQRHRPLDRGKTHVLDRSGVRAAGHVVQHLPDRGGQEVAYSHVQPAEPPVLAPLLVIVVELPQRGQRPADRRYRAGAVVI